MKERDIIRRLRDAFADEGLGDDAAVLEPPGGELLLASDAVVEGVHFSRGYGTLGQAVQKAITSNVSDIYAMGGEPRSILITAGLPAGCGEREIESIIGGISLACEVYGIGLAGGDTVKSPGGYFFDVAVTGSVERGRAIRRSGARAGDAVVLFGACGASLAGLMILDRLYDGDVSASRNDAIAPGNRVSGAVALTRNLVPAEPAVREGIKNIIPSLSLSMTGEDIGRLCGGRGLGLDATSLVACAQRHLVPRAQPLPPGCRRETGEQPYITALIDISDGLARDLATMCAESAIGASIEEARVPVHPALERLLMSVGPGNSPAGRKWAPGVQEDLTELLLSSGEEYVLLAAVRGLLDDSMHGGAAREDSSNRGAVPGGSSNRDGVLGDAARDDATFEGVLPSGATVIGSIVDRGEGVTLLTQSGRRRPLPELGYEHEF